MDENINVNVLPLPSPAVGGAPAKAFFVAIQDEEISAKKKIMASKLQAQAQATQPPSSSSSTSTLVSRTPAPLTRRALRLTQAPLTARTDRNKQTNNTGNSGTASKKGEDALIQLNASSDSLESHDFSVAPPALVSANAGDVDEFLRAMAAAAYPAPTAPASAANMPAAANVADWSRQVSYLLVVRRLVHSAPERLVGFAPALYKLIVAAMDSLRSGLSKAAMIIMGETLTRAQSQSLLLLDLKKSLPKELLVILLRRTVEGEKFLHPLASELMAQFIEKLSAIKVFTALVGQYENKNKTLRSHTAQFLYRSLKLLKVQGLHVQDQLPELLKAIMVYKSDALMETKNAATAMLPLVAIKFSEGHIAAALKKLEHKRAQELAVLLKAEGYQGGLGAGTGVVESPATALGGSATMGPARPRAKSVFSPSVFATMKKRPAAPASGAANGGYSLTMPETPGQVQSASKGRLKLYPSLKPSEAAALTAAASMSAIDGPEGVDVSRYQEDDNENEQGQDSDAAMNTTIQQADDEPAILNETQPTAAIEETFDIVDYATMGGDADGAVSFKAAASEQGGSGDGDGAMRLLEFDEGATHSISYHSNYNTLSSPAPAPSAAQQPQPLSIHPIPSQLAMAFASPSSPGLLSPTSVGLLSPSHTSSNIPTAAHAAHAANPTAHPGHSRLLSHDYINSGDCGLLDETLEDLMNRNQLDMCERHLEEEANKEKRSETEAQQGEQGDAMESVEIFPALPVYHAPLAPSARKLSGNKRKLKGSDDLSDSAQSQPQPPHTPAVGGQWKRLATPRPPLAGSAKAARTVAHTPHTPHHAIAHSHSQSSLPSLSSAAAAPLVRRPSVPFASVCARPDFSQHASERSDAIESALLSTYSELEAAHQLIESLQQWQSGASGAAAPCSIAQFLAAQAALAASLAAARERIVEQQEKDRQELMDAIKIHMSQSQSQPQSQPQPQHSLSHSESATGAGSTVEEDLEEEDME